MNCIIVTGLSGAGKSRAMDVFEDLGYFCIDNMPPQLVSKFIELCDDSEKSYNSIALAVDIRSGKALTSLKQELDNIQSADFNYKILFLDANNQTLLSRYKQTRRIHPLQNNSGSLSLEGAIEKERELLMPMRDNAHYVIDTSLLSSAQLNDFIISMFSENGKSGMKISCISFGFKYGIPTDADLVFDLRCLPNPFYIDNLKRKTGLDCEVSDYVMQFDVSKNLFAKLIDLVDYLIPLYINEGKSQLCIAIGCTGGKHRSVTFAEAINNHIMDSSFRVRASVSHRDINKQ